MCWQKRIVQVAADLIPLCTSTVNALSVQHGAGHDSALG
jgi:hypothetical protein